MCCAIKPMASWLFERVVTTCRERCGGAGYLACNRFGEMMGSAHAAMTAEGDNSVLMQKVSGVSTGGGGAPGREWWGGEGWETGGERRELGRDDRNWAGTELETLADGFRERLRRKVRRAVMRSWKQNCQLVACSVRLPEVARIGWGWRKRYKIKTC